MVEILFYLIFFDGKFVTALTREKDNNKKQQQKTKNPKKRRPRVK